MSTDAPVDPPPLTADEHRRTLGHLSHPRSLASLVRALDDDRGAMTLGIATIDRIKAVLTACLEAGLAKNVGDIRKARDLAAIPNADPDVIDIPDEQAALLRQRARAYHLRDRYLDEGDKFILTRAGLELLTGPVPNEPPPLTGVALREALRRNVQLAEEALSAERERAGGAVPMLVNAARTMLLEQQEALREFLEAFEELDDDDEDGRE